MKYLKMLVLAAAAFFVVPASEAAIVDYTYDSGSLSGEGYVWTLDDFLIIELTSYEFELYYDDSTNTAYEYFSVSDGTNNYSFYGHWNPGVPGAAFIDSPTNCVGVWHEQFNSIIGSQEFFSLHPVPPPPPPEW